MTRLTSHQHPKKKTAPAGRARRTLFAAGASALSAAAIAGAMMGSQPASAATASPAHAGSLVGTAQCWGEISHMQQYGNNKLGDWWSSYNTAYYGNGTVPLGTCVHQVREVVHYPKSEYLTWKVSVDGKTFGSKRVYGTAGSTHYTTWPVNQWITDPKMPQVCITAGNNWSCERIFNAGV